MYITFTLLFFFSAVILQTSVFQFLTIGGMKPDLVLIIVVYLGLIRGPEIGCLTGFSFGLIADFFSGTHLLGSNALTKTIVGFFCGLGGKQLYTHSIFSQLLCVAVSTVVDIVVQLGIRGFIPEWKQILLYEILYNLLCCPLIVMIFHQAEKQLGVRSSTPKF